MSYLLKQVAEPLDESIRHIPLTQGQVAIVDAEDYEFLMQWKWTAQYAHKSRKFYAMRNVWTPGTKQEHAIYMHKLIMGNPQCEVDHRDRDTLNMRRSNLRTCTRAQNVANVALRRDNSSGYKGVHRKIVRGSKCWCARVSYKGRRIYIGDFLTREEAALAYNKKALELHGEFAWLNPVQDTPKLGR